MSKFVEYRIRCDTCGAISQFSSSLDYIVEHWAREHGWRCDRPWRRPAVDTCPDCLALAEHKERSA